MARSTAQIRTLRSLEVVKIRVPSGFHANYGVLQALGLSRADAERSLRVSLHAQSTGEDVASCLTALARVVKNLRALHV